MRRKITSLIVVAAFLLVAGCQATPTPTPIIWPTVTPEVVNTQVPNIIYVTATPGEAEQPNVITATPEGAELTATAETVVPSATPNASITIDAVDDLGSGKAMVHWTPTGSFPSGYAVVWSATNQKPVYPTDANLISADPATRSAQVTLEMNKIYYLRVCRLVSGSCDIYSNLGIFALTKSTTVTPTVTQTPVKSATPVSSGHGYTSTPVYNSFNASGTPIASSSGITITGMTNTTSGQAKITWTASGTFSSGFILVYSTSYKLPYPGGYEYYTISDSTARTAYVTGTPGTTYYYRLCRRTGSATCDIYSNYFTFTYAGSTPTPVYTVTGTPPTSTPTKTLAPTATSTGTSTTAPSATSTATATATATATFTPTATTDPATITISSISDKSSGTATVKWTSSGSFPDGYVILLSDTNTSPTISDTTVYATSGETSKDISGTAGTKYYVRMCKLSGGICTIYSSVTEFTFAKMTMLTLTAPSEGQAHMTWSDSGDFTNGIWWIASITTNTPTYADYDYRGLITDGTETSASFSVVPGLTYYFRVCQANANTPSDGCLIYSDVISLYFSSSLVITDPPTKVGSDVTLDWTGPTGTPYTFDGYKIFRSDQSLAIASVSSSTLTYTDTSVPNGTYTYLICAYQGTDCAGFSDNDVTVTIP